MVQTDPIADFFTRLRNAGKAKHETIELPASKIKIKLAEILKDEGYIGDFQVLPGTPVKTMKVTLRYRRPGEPMISTIKRISKPGCRHYASTDDIAGWKSVISTTILTTSKGIMTHIQALQANVGGEVICRLE